MSFFFRSLAPVLRLSPTRNPAGLTSVLGVSRIHISTITKSSSQEAAPRRILSSFSLHDKVCVVTGAARGLGNVFAHAFVESGCSKIALIDLSLADASRAASSLTDWFIHQGVVRPNEIEAVGYGLDVSDEDGVKEVMQNVVQKWGRIDCLVTSAGIVHNYSALEYPVDRIKALYDVNVHGSFFCAREAARHMIEQQTAGSIVLIASMSANIVNIPQLQTPYNASKAAVKHMAASLAVEWAQYGIRVNALSPGYMRTALTDSVLESNRDLQDTWVNSTPMRRIGSPDDLKGAIVLLASDASKFITGTELRVDGGYTVI